MNADLVVPMETLHIYIKDLIPRSGASGNGIAGIIQLLLQAFRYS